MLSVLRLEAPHEVLHRGWRGSQLRAVVAAISDETVGGSADAALGVFFQVETEATELRAPFAGLQINGDAFCKISSVRTVRACGKTVRWVFCKNEHT